MILTKKSEKLVVWMFRSKITGQDIAKEFGVTRQAFSQKLKENNFSDYEKRILKRLGFNE